ncbi:MULTISPECIES: DinB family protein [unclassified Streptomyces]|uniref:DinB family protein n=1 Tax=unclassified Streptomyces TaxID=2593676 RepID=UPI001BECED3C|nr:MULTISPECIES: DinB family protein [unclassified Streptomyces]MBT2407450.1 DinB family protein [Streptomyces sp. ISL-21]MBT2457103.1 DinB family protein [Streptomyces sp. ISL-86]MBT2612664.1 DinB family protein [Streptomyces sp. ISL-87]
MPLSRTRPDYTADERTQLLGWLDMQRAIITWKCEGLPEEAAHRAVLPASPLMTAAGLISHLRWVEQYWFEVVLLGHPSSGPRFEGGKDGDFLVADVPLAQLLEEYEAQCAAANEIIAAHSLDDTGRSTEFEAGAASMRWILLHMIEETARHAGHLDAIRELLDGGTGYR